MYLRNTVLSNTTGSVNTATGASALQSNTTGDNNTASGTYALQDNTTGSDNTANGNSALRWNTTGFSNTASGSAALASNTTGTNNTANGSFTLNRNTTGSGNTADGSYALNNNTTGGGNTAVGGALSNNTTGSGNVALGVMAGANLVSGNSNIMVGDHAGATFTSNESYNIDIGNGGSLGDSNVIRIGGSQTKTYISGMRGQTTGNNDAVAVLIDSNGQLGTVSSSRRYKEDIRDMGGASDGLLRLRPVTFRYKQPYADGSKPVQYGLVAEEVADVYPDLVAFNKDGQPETVQYYKLDAMLLNEVQKLANEHAADQAEIERLQSQIAEQRKERQEQQAELSQVLAQVRVIQARLARKSATRPRIRAAKNSAVAARTPKAPRPNTKDAVNQLVAKVRF